MNSIIHALKTTRWLKNTLISLCVIGALLVILPFGIQWGAQYALKDQGATEATIDDVNLNLFTGEFELLNLHAVFNNEPALKLSKVLIDVDMGALFLSQVIIENALIQGLNAKVVRSNEGVIGINGYQLPAPKPANDDKEKNKDSKPLDIALHSLTFENSAISYSEEKFNQNIVIKNISVENFISWEKDSVTHINALIEENKTHISASIDATLISDVITLKGDVDVKGLNTKPYQKFYQQHLQKLNAGIDINAQFNLALGEKIKGDIKHNIKLSQLLAHYEPFKYSFDTLTSQGSTHINGETFNIEAELLLNNSKLVDLASSNTLKTLKHLSLNVKSQLVLGEQLKAEISHQLVLNQLQAHHQQLDYSLNQLSSKGNTTLNGNEISVNAQLKLNDSQLIDAESKTLLKSFKTLALNNFHFDADEISFSDLTLSDIKLLKDSSQKQLLSLETLSLQQFEFKPVKSQMSLQLVELQQPNINATLSEQKQITHLAIIDPIFKRFKGEATKSVEKKPTESQPMAINIEQIRLTKPGLLHFNDLSVSPNYSTQLHFNKIEIDHISNDKPADFTLALKQGEYTTIDIKGEGLLLNPAEHLTYTINIKQLDLPPISSYTTKTMGYGVKSGVIDTVIKGSIKQQQIDTHVALIIDSIEVVETNKETAEEMSGASGMSIDLALSTLKDENNIINLEMPIGGDIEKPDFDLSLIINKAMGIAMKAATFGYLKLALEPFSSLVTLFNIANDAASSISLAPIIFNVNKTQLVSKQKELLDKVSNILTERPGIKIKTCSVTSLSDQTAIKEQLLDAQKQAYLKQQKGKKISKKLQTIAVSALKIDNNAVIEATKNLADKRSANIKAYLTGVKKVKPARILNCLSTKNSDKKSKPVVELVI